MAGWQGVTVDHARGNGLELAVRGGGRRVPGFGDAVSVDPAARKACAQDGTT